MPQFINNSCVALTWSADGQCHGIRVKRLRGKCKVTSVWAAKADKDHSVSELLAVGLRELDGKDASCLLASGTAGGWDMADVEMPHLPEEQLKHALSFEIQKHTPLSIDKLTWGYRQLRKPTTTTKGLYRIITMKSENWRQWCTTVEALSPLDAIIPAPAALDPLLENQTVTFPAQGTAAESWLPTPDGRSFRSSSSSDTDGNPKSLAELLGIDFADLEELEGLSVQEQYGYAHALILAIYGLTAESSKDSLTGLPLPEKLRRHRSLALVFLAGALIAVTVAALVLYFALLLQSNYSQVNELKREIAEVERQIVAKRNIVKADRLKKIDELRLELKDAVPNYPPFPLVLNDITRIFRSDMPNKPWISGKLIWSHDTNTIKFSIEEPSTDGSQKPFIEQTELLDALSDSPYIIDARGNSSTFNRAENKIVRDFTLTIGWPSAEERAARAKRNEVREKEYQESLRKKKLAEQKAREEQERAAAAEAAAAAAEANAAASDAAQPAQPAQVEQNNQPDNALPQPPQPPQQPQQVPDGE